MLVVPSCLSWLLSTSGGVCCGEMLIALARDVAPPQANSAVAAGAANSAAVPSADDIGDDDDEPSVNGKPSS